MPDSIIDKRESRWSDQRVKEMIERGSKEGRKHAFVSCWSMQDPEFLSMWKIYTPDATGVAIKSTVGQLANCFISRPNDLFERFEARIEKVTYIDFVSHEAIDEEFDRFIHKQESYTYEKEIRVLISSRPTFERPRIGIGLKVDLDVLIDKIYVSHRLGDGLEEFVEDILRENRIDKEVVYPPFVRTPKY
ncbi:MAG: hypothetical protein KAU38_02065 [Desulfobacterales bacterium]|nr:hypothetical protein [Desulfobacterales bacterium]